MPKSQRLVEMMLTVNRKRTFTVKELAREFGVSSRTILRDLQELSELGVPLYAEVGPHGGYRVLNRRLLPPIAFTEKEAAAVFFAIHALRPYSSLPFEAEASSVLNKFYAYLPEDVRSRIDLMKDRVEFVTPARRASSPHLSLLLDAAVEQKVLLIEYETKEGRTEREIQPIGIYTRNGLWYCPAYSFERREMRVFRCDRIREVKHAATEPLDLRHLHLGNRNESRSKALDTIRLVVELTPAGVEVCEAEPWQEPRLHIREDGTGWLEGTVSRQDLPFFARFFLRLGKDVTVNGPPELLGAIRQELTELAAHYGSS
ncbi:DeoR family transcriptional regulator [Paenibacillus sp. J31TS4]|uniref:helix-turn-helix transcriptional regulator n=1 Tax=Paenibacillus sp. J31TS4 TaxID=2807195 RepID=UPI001B146AD9|nr:YafY family protein [Paenibacillus sp. J31TS4]GIP39830.1 DeoR family transcriptional regulator [Paenibacillus sp. J31TS4]